ncbi:glycerophosphodiester phosphodiesterase family protein [Corynebacterium pacaense]|uniref:glycerophosphodiester phosphodiesterase family protein n=1 Tax=Corynebacterium pacaense TaxID=1816684 RepID=UPI0009BAF98C|nr:glycerophosphodiester phosphodiesterase family protein [Corynebacterium pacaense]
MKIIAHRGLSSQYPELTESAFVHALELPIHGIETDLRLSRCGELVNIHDPVISRVSDGRGRVSAMDLTTLRTFNFGTRQAPERVLTLDDLLDIMEDYPDKHLYIESKHPMRYSIMLEEQIVRVLRYRGLSEDPRIHVISFSLPAIHWMSRLAPSIDRIHLRRAWERWINPTDRRLGDPTGLGLSIERARLNPSLIGRKNLPTYLFTVDKPRDVLWAQDHGVDMLATNVPDEVAQVLDTGVAPAMYANAHGKEE